MTIEVANRLYELRKKSGLSQEELADKLGISRQSVSKWERAEASPDTDNLILLSKLYGVSLDELLTGSGKAEGGSQENPAVDQEYDYDDGKEHVHIGLDGIHVTSGTDKVHVSWKGVHVEENGEEKVHVGRDGIRVDGEVKSECDLKACHRREKENVWLIIPIPIITVIAYLLWSFLADAWNISWLIFFAIPLYYSLADAIKKHDANHFAYPVLVAFVFLLIGMVWGIWSPSWVVFVTIPLYYWLVSFIRKLSRKDGTVEVDSDVYVRDDDDDDDDDEDDDVKRD